MSQEYRSMWADLGLDLDAHDQLLAVLSKAYQDIYIAQESRPSTMSYFDFVMSEVHGLRVKELVDAQKAGRKVVGAWCVFVPEEIVLAADAIFVGLCAGADFAIDEVENLLPRNTCALIKSSLGFKLGKVCPYVETADMIVGENTCDGKKKMYETFNTLVDNLYVMDIPQVKSADGRALMRNEFRKFLVSVEEKTGVTIDVKRLRKGIELVNAKRSAMHRLFALRAADPAPISGLDALLINQISFYDDPIRFTDSVNAVCDELEQLVAAGSGAHPKGTARVLVSGCPMAVPNWKLPAIIEGAGAVIVGEESCVGERGLRNLVSAEGETMDDLLDALVDRYFQVDCAIFTPNTDRLDHIKQMAKDYKADGVIHYGLNFCQPYQMEAIPVARALEAEGIPTLRIDTDYSMEDVEQLKTRVEAFLEML